MRHTLYEVDNKIYSSAKIVCYIYGMNINNFRSKLHRHGGVANCVAFNINGRDIVIHSKVLMPV